MCTLLLRKGSTIELIAKMIFDFVILL